MTGPARSPAMHAPMLAQTAGPTLLGTPVDAIVMVLGLALLAALVVLDARRRLRDRSSKP